MTEHRWAYAGLVLFTLVLYVRPNDLLPIGDFPVAKVVGAGALAALLLERLVTARPLTVMPRELKYLLGVLALMCLSVPLALNPDEAVETIEGLYLKVVLIFVLMINAVTSYARLRQLMGLTSLCAGWLAVEALTDFIAGKDLVETYRAGGVRSGMFGNPNDLALAVAMLIPLAIALALTARRLPARLLWLGTAGAMAGAVVVTFSRSGFLSLVAAAMYALATIGRRPARAVVLILLGGMALVSFGPSGYAERVLSIFEHSLDPTGSAEARTELLRRALQVVAYNPKVWVVGVGAGNFHIVSIHEAGTHNAYLEVLTEIGLPALVLYLLFLTGAFRGLRDLAKSNRRGQDQDALSVIAQGIRASLLAFAVGSVFASVAYQWYLYYAAGYAVCLRAIARARRPVSDATRECAGPGVHRQAHLGPAPYAGISRAGG
jgi:O-antigen ligase